MALDEPHHHEWVHEAEHYGRPDRGPERLDRKAQDRPQRRRYQERERHQQPLLLPVVPEPQRRQDTEALTLILERSPLQAGMFSAIEFIHEIRLPAARGVAPGLCDTTCRCRHA